MKKILLSLILASSFLGVAQAQFQEINEGLEDETIFPEENYESELMAQREEEEEIGYQSPIDSQEDYAAEEEVYDDEVEYSE